MGPGGMVVQAWLKNIILEGHKTISIGVVASLHLEVASLHLEEHHHWSIHHCRCGGNRCGTP